MSQEQHLHHAVAERLRTVATLIGEPLNEPLDINGQEVVPGLGLLNEAAQLNNRADRVEQGQFRVAALGAVSRGKSTLLNACLGKEIFPIGPQAVTGGICQVVYGSNNFDEVTLIEQGVARTMPYAEFHDWISLSSEEQKLIAPERRFQMPERLANLDYALLQTDAPLCKQGIQFVDTLGFNAGPKQEFITKEFLLQADALLVVLGTDPVIDAKDDEIINLYYHNGGEGSGNMFFVINNRGLRKKDCRLLIEETAPRELGAFFLNAEGEFDKTLFDQRVFLVNARSAFERKVAGAADDVLAQTGILALERAFERLMSENEHARIAGNAAVNHTLVLTKLASNEIKLQKAILDTSIERLDDAHKNLDKLSTSLRKDLEEIEKKFSTFSRDIGLKAGTHLNDYFANRLDDWDETWKEVSPNINLWDLFKALRKKGKDELAERLEPEIEKHFSNVLKKWGDDFSESIKEDLADFATELKTDVTNFVIQLDEFAAKLTPDVADSLDTDKRRARKVTQILLGLVPMAEAMPFDLNQLVGPMMDDRWKSTFYRAFIHIAVFSGLVWLISNFIGPVGFITLVALTIAEVGIVFWKDETFASKKIGEAIGAKLRTEFVKHSPELRQVITDKVNDFFKPIAEAASKGLRNEVKQLEWRLGSAREQRRAGQISVDAEKARLETISSLLTAQFEELSTAVYGEVLTPEEQEALLERFFHPEDEDDA